MPCKPKTLSAANPETGDTAMLRGEPFDPASLHGISFFDRATARNMRYIYPDAGHWCAGWIVAQNPSGEWMTWRKATDADIAVISRAVVIAHHSEGDSNA